MVAMVSHGTAFESPMAIGVHITPAVVVAAKNNHVRRWRGDHYGPAVVTRPHISDAAS
jgi:hypothetical protein